MYFRKACNILQHIQQYAQRYAQWYAQRYTPQENNLIVFFHCSLLSISFIISSTFLFSSHTIHHNNTNKNFFLHSTYAFMWAEYMCYAMSCWLYIKMYSRKACNILQHTQQYAQRYTPQEDNLIDFFSFVRSIVRSIVRCCPYLRTQSTTTTRIKIFFLHSTYAFM